MKVLISAYACEPGKGSEPGVGWNWVTAASRRHEVCVLTRANNRAPIEQALAVAPLPTVRFVYLDLPPWARAWKRQQHGVRLYYAAWQVLAAREARRLCRVEGFDVVHHVTFANLWLPALTCLAGPPFVLGPVGGGQRVPMRLAPLLGVRAGATELALRLRGVNRFNPFVRIAWERAAVVLVNNRETLAVLPPRVRARARLRPNACAALVRPERTGEASVSPVAACVGRLNRFKGVELAVRALAHAPDWQLLVIGAGDDRARLEQVARRLGVEDRVRFTGQLTQPALWELLGTCDALLLPSLKEGAPSVAAESQALGVPVVALEAHGAAALAETPGARFELVVPRGRDETARALAAALERVRLVPGAGDAGAFGLDAVERDLEAVYAEAVQPRTETERRRARLART